MFIFIFLKLYFCWPDSSVLRQVKDSCARKIARGKDVNQFLILNIPGSAHSYSGLCVEEQQRTESRFGLQYLL